RRAIDRSGGGSRGPGAEGDLSERRRQGSLDGVGAYARPPAPPRDPRERLRGGADDLERLFELAEARVDDPKGGVQVVEDRVELRSLVPQQGAELNREPVGVL